MLEIDGNVVTIVLDVSRYQPDVDYELLFKRGVHGVIVKATQGDYSTDSKFVEHVNNAAEAGLVVGAYHWCDPNNDAVSQAEHLMDTIRDLPVNFVAVDAEQYWQDWDEWLKWIRREVPRISKIVPPGTISKVTKKTAQHLRTNLEMQVVIYTRYTYMAEHAAPMLNWVCEFPVWLAEWPKGGGNEVIAWKEFRNTQLPTYPSPRLPNGCSRYTFWQFSGDRYVLPGLGGAKVDVNVFNGSTADLRVFAGLKKSDGPGSGDQSGDDLIDPGDSGGPGDEEESGGSQSGSGTPKIPVLPRARVTTASVNVRTEPSIAAGVDVRTQLTNGDIIPVIDIIRDGDNIWLQIGWKDYVAMRFGGFDLLEWV